MPMNIPAAVHIETALEALASESPARRVALLADCAHELYSVGAPAFHEAGFPSVLTFDAGYFLGLRVAAVIVAGGGEL